MDVQVTICGHCWGDLDRKVGRMEHLGLNLLLAGDCDNVRIHDVAFDDILIHFSLQHFILLCRIGLGDFAPKTRNGRIAAILMIPTLVAAAGEVLAGIGLALVEHRQKEVYQNQLKTGLTEDFLEQMDKDGDGKVSREEYILYMLMEMGAVSQHEIDELCKQFRRLDVARTGYIDKMDLLLMQKLRDRKEASPPAV
jgi:EF hand